ncbi:hypothetical protein ACFVHB_39190 [Kitasatospora sp. NPDC127111]|uniref:hypothetical protein n=1 Tax=Kitasatospora sp. NPDC127111 TaxID=3345363 RepID=UPI003631540A
MSAKKFRLVSVVAAATVVLGAAAGLAAEATGTAAPDRGAATVADQQPTTQAGSTTGTGAQQHNPHRNDMGWQW